MDRLDRWTVVSVIAMSLYASVLMYMQGGTSQAVQEERGNRTAPQHTVSPELEGKMQTVKNLLAQDNLEKTEALLTPLLEQFPYEGELYLLRGDVLMRRQQPIAAMYQYKEAIQLNPDFLDKKTPQFQGRKIKVAVEEAKMAIESGLQAAPGDDKLKSDQKILYFMKRKLAGSCG
jgi:tetratricopeptide (TPR) repeat protein